MITRTNEAWSIVESDLEIEGALTFKGRLMIKGTVRGELTGDTVVIQEKGVFNGNARVGRMTIGGVFDGDLVASGDIVVLASGSFSGNAVCKDIKVEGGGLLNGSVTCLDQGAAAPPGGVFTKTP